jgi:hypothetical protein
MKAAKGDGEDRERGFRHPQESSVARKAGLSQQIEIAAPHEAKACSRQADRAVTEVIRLPGWAGWNAGGTEQHARDLSIRFAGDVSIERAQSKHEPSTLVQGNTIGWPARRSPRSNPPQAGRSLCSRSEPCIKGNDDCRRRIGARGVDEHRG